MFDLRYHVASLAAVFLAPTRIPMISARKTAASEATW